MAKKIRVAPATTTNWVTLPGNTGDYNLESASLDDTIFGSEFKSSQPDLLSWRVTSNALYKGYSGYQAKIMLSGAPVTMTDEPMSLVSGKTYRITDSTKRLIDVGTAVVVEDNAVDKNAQVLSINYLFGTVTFANSYVVTGPVTITGKYVPTTQICSMNKYSLQQQAEAINQTDICLAQSNGGYIQNAPGLKSVGLELSGFYKSTNAFTTALSSRELVLIELNPDGAGKSLCRGFFKPKSTGESGRVGQLEEDKISYDLYVPDVSLAGNANDVLSSAFAWQHDNTSTLNTGVRTLLSAWETNALVEMRYLEDGVAGKQGSAVVTNLSLAGGLAAMNEFSVQLTGSGAITLV